MVPLARITGLAAALCLAAAAPASAAFAPDLTLSVDPTTASSHPAFTATFTQPASESPVERFTLNLGPGFEIAGAPSAQAGDVIGAVKAQIGRGADFTGTIRKLSPDRFEGMLTGLGGSIEQEIQGSIVKRANGSLDLRFDQLPALPFTSLTFSFAGGGLSLIRAPATCGDHPVTGKFTSRAGGLALDLSRLSVTGCDGVPAVQVANVRMSRTAFRPGGYHTIIAWWAARSVDHTNVRIERRVHGRWRVLGVLVGRGEAGENTVRWDGRLRGRALRRGGYGLRIQPAGSAPSKLARFRIL